MGNIVTERQLSGPALKSLSLLLLAMVMVAVTGCSDDISSAETDLEPPDELAVPHHDEDKIYGVDHDALQRGLAKIRSLPGNSVELEDKAAPPPVSVVEYASLTCPDVVDFQEMAGVVRSYDNLLRFGGLEIGEKFAGQIKDEFEYQGFDHDFILAPFGQDDPLQVEAGAKPGNLSTYRRPSGRRSMGGNGANGILEPAVGAMAVQFDTPQSEIGLVLVGVEDEGAALFRFYRADGTLIYPVEVVSESRRNVLAFRRDGGVADISGMLLYNLDPGGLRVDRIVYCE